MHYNLPMDKQQNSTVKQDACLVVTEQKLYQFSQSPQAQFPKQGLKGSSTSATVVCAFLIGAAKTFASNDEELQLTLADQLGLDDRGTTHLIDTTRRLGKKYPFVKQILKQGQQTATAWQENDTLTVTTSLDQLVQKCQNLTLMDLKKIVVAEDLDPTISREATSQAVEGNSRLKRLLLILLALIILVTANYLIFTLF